MTDHALCTRTTKAGKPCKARALPGMDVCFSHAKTSEDQRRAQRVQSRRRAARKLSPAELARGKTTDIALDVAARCLVGVPLTTPGTVTSYNGKREVTDEGVYLGVLILLAITGPHMTPEDAQTALLDAVPLSMRPHYVPDPDDAYRHGRARWRESLSSLRYSEVRGLFLMPYPDDLIPPWSNVQQVYASEPLPTFETWTETTEIEGTTDVAIYEPGRFDRLKIVQRETMPERLIREARERGDEGARALAATGGSA
jgi:hypothetical protein